MNRQDQRINSRKTRSNAWVRVLGASAFVACCACGANAFAQTPDVVQSGGVSILRGGGIRGVVKNPNATDFFEIEPALGGKIVVDADEVKQATALRPEQLSYRNFAPLQPDKVESQLKIARWAATNQLSSFADLHFQRVVELDPENEEARKALGHVKENGVWVSKKERMEQRGLEHAGGRNVSKQEAELIRAAEKKKEEARYWKKETRVLYQNAKNQNQQARDAMRRIRNPVALAPLVEFYSHENDPEGRVLLVQAIGSIGTPAALGELGKIALNDDDLDVRVAAINGICNKKTARTEAIEYFRRKLRGSDDVATINRAAYALNLLNAEQAIPDLINSLITAHKRQVVVGSQQTGATFDSTGNVSGFSPGGGGRVKTVTDLSQNEEVHNALSAIVANNFQTPVDYGFEVDAWIAWRRQVDQLGNFYPRRDR